MSIEIARRVLRFEAEAIERLSDTLNGPFLEALDILEACKGRVVATGMGKSGIIARKIAATLASTGSPALFLHPAEALHGDLGMVVAGDCVIALSNSGETDELNRLMEYLKRLGVPVIAITADAESTLGRSADVCLATGDHPEACNLGLAPTTSTTVSLAMGDAVAVALSVRKGFRMEDFAALHPGGKLGKKLLRIVDLMRTGADVPCVPLGTSMRVAVVVMSEGRMGITAIVDADQRLVGVISDGDLRRLIARHADILDFLVDDCLTPHPKTISPDVLAASALERMEHNKITSLFVVDEAGRLTGAVHLHDLWGTELF